MIFFKSLNQISFLKCCSRTQHYLQTARRDRSRQSGCILAETLAAAQTPCRRPRCPGAICLLCLINNSCRGMKLKDGGIFAHHMTQYSEKLEILTWKGSFVMLSCCLTHSINCHIRPKSSTNPAMWDMTPGFFVRNGDNYGRIPASLVSKESSQQRPGQKFLPLISPEHLDGANQRGIITVF